MALLPLTHAGTHFKDVPREWRVYCVHDLAASLARKREERRAEERQVLTADAVCKELVRVQRSLNYYLLFLRLYVLAGEC
jgi:hypothetical protein